MTHIVPKPGVSYKLGDSYGALLAKDNKLAHYTWPTRAAAEADGVDIPEEGAAFVQSLGYLHGEISSPVSVNSGTLELCPGLTVVMGTAGTGKSTTLEVFSKQLESQAQVVRIDCFEPTPLALSPRQMWRELNQVLLTRDFTKPFVVIIDSLRFMSVLNSGYPTRLAAGAMDLSILAALTDLDQFAQKIGIHIIASLFFNLYQVTKGDAFNETAVTNGLRTFAIDVDGSASNTLLMGPTRREAGRYEFWSRRQRMASVTGQVALEAAPTPAPAADGDPGTDVHLRYAASLSPAQRATAPERSIRQANRLIANQRKRETAADIHRALNDSAEVTDAVINDNASEFLRGIPSALKEVLN